MRWFKKKKDQLKQNGRRNAVYEYTPNGKFVRRYDSVKECNKRNFPECNPSNSLFRKYDLFEKYGVLRDGNYVFTNEVGKNVVLSIAMRSMKRKTLTELSKRNYIEVSYDGWWVATCRNEFSASILTGMRVEQVLRIAETRDLPKGCKYNFVFKISE